MKLVSQFSSPEEAEGASQLLEANGIATFISSEMSNRLGGLFTGAFHVGLWVVLDQQFHDAHQLLADPTHRVSRKLSDSEMMQLKASVQSSDMSQIVWFLFRLLILVLLFALGVSILVRT